MAGSSNPLDHVRRRARAGNYLTVREELFVHKAVILTGIGLAVAAVPAVIYLVVKRGRKGA